MSAWFEIDKEGLAAQLERREKGFALHELYQNAIDEASRIVTIDLESTTRGRARLVVTDDNPSGFENLKDAYTAFGLSKKAGDATKRGRFNIGEIHVLALCASAEISSTTGTIIFHEDGTRSRSRRRTDVGSIFSAEIRMTRPEVEAALALIKTVLVPPGVELLVNGEAILPRTPLMTIAVKGLPTEIDHRQTARNTTMEIHRPLTGETPHLYELGIPVVEIDTPFHVSVGQKILLNSDRDNVTPSYARRIRTEVLNATHELLDDEEAAAPWTTNALGSDGITDDAVRTILHRRFGPKPLTYDPSDIEANKRATAEGYTVIPGGALSREAWANVKRAEVAPPAGKVLPTPHPKSSPDGIPPIPYEDWTSGMREIARYAHSIAHALIGQEITVDMSPVQNGFGASYGHNRLTFYVLQLGQEFFDNPDQIEVDSLLIHELAHHVEGDHLSKKYHEACCRLGAKIRNVTLRLAPPDSCVAVA